MIDEIDAAIIDKKCRFDTGWHVLGLTACTRADHNQRELFYLETILGFKFVESKVQSAIPEVDFNRSGVTIDYFIKMSQVKHALMFYVDATAT